MRLRCKFAIGVCLMLTFGCISSRGAEPSISALLKHYETSGLKLQGVTLYDSVYFAKDGFDTVEMGKVRGRDPKNNAIAYSFTLYRHKSIEKTKLRLELGEMMKWEMLAVDTVVLQWDEGSEKRRILDIFKLFNVDGKNE